MRRTLFVALVLGLVVVGASPVAARDVGNGSDSMVQLWGVWGTYDDQTGASFYAEMFATDWGNAIWIDYHQSTATPITCDDGSLGFAYEEFWGGGQGTSFTYTRSYTSGEAAGVVGGWLNNYTDCSMGGEVVTPNHDGGGHDATFTVSGTFTSTSPVVRERSSGSFKIPGQVNTHTSERSEYRGGDFFASVDGAEFTGYGQLGKVSWRYHSNVR